jgi:heme/copper-type cytochrome/quinol oxidase subunit 1
MILTGNAFVAEERTPPPGRGWAAGHLLALAIASVLALLFALAVRLQLLAPASPRMDVETFRQLALIRDAFFALALALPSIAALGHLLLPPAQPDSRTARLDHLAAGAQLGGAALLMAATGTRAWTSLLLLAGAGALVCFGGALQALGFLGRLRTPLPRRAAPTSFARALSVTAIAELIALPIATAAFACLVTERVAHAPLWHHAAADPILFEHWLRRALALLPYVALLPCLGVAADQLQVRSRALPVAFAALALLGGVAGAARVFGGDGPAATAVFSFFALALLVPATVVVGNLAAYGRVDASPASWLALAFVLCFAELTIAGLPLAMADRGRALAATTFAAAHQQLLLAAIAFAVASALHRAWPALAARPHGARLAQLGCAIAFFGVQLAAATQLVAGGRGMPLTLEYPAPLRALAVATAIGWLLAIAGAVLIGANVVAAARDSARG